MFEAAVFYCVGYQHAVCRLIADVPLLDAALGGVLSYWGRNTLAFYCVNAPIYVRAIPSLLGLAG